MSQSQLNPIAHTDDGLAWSLRHNFGLASGPLDTIAVGDGTGPRDLTRSSLRNEIHREPFSGSAVDIEEDDTDERLLYAIIELGGGLELDAGQEITEVGIFTTATTPETMVYLYVPPSPVPFPSGERNSATMPILLRRGN